MRTRIYPPHPGVTYTKQTKIKNKVGHIEDVVVDAAARGTHVGVRLVTALLDAARAAGCYKVILDCAEHNVAFYERAGLARKGVEMVRRWLFSLCCVACVAAVLLLFCNSYARAGEKGGALALPAAPAAILGAGSMFLGGKWG